MSTIYKIVDTNGTSGVLAHALYGICTTAAGTVKKEVTCADWTMGNTIPTGIMLAVKFSNGNTASSPTLSVNGNTAKTIQTQNTNKPGTTERTSWRTKSIVLFVYDGSYWTIVGTYESKPHVYIGAASAASSAATTNGNTYLKLFSDNLAGEQYKISGSGAASVTSDNSGNITVSSTDSKTTSSNSASKMFLIGATTQSTSGQTTYSNSGLYGTDGKLFSTGIENAGQLHSDYSMYVGAYVDTNERGVYLGTADDHDRIVSLQRTNTGGGILRIGQFGSSSSIILHAPNITFGSDSDTSPSSSQLTVDGDYLTITKQTRVNGNILTTGNIIARNDNTSATDDNNYGLRVFDGVDNLNLVMFRRTTGSTPNSRFTFANVIPSTSSSLSSPQNEVFIGNGSTTEYRLPGIITSQYGTGSGTNLVVNTSTGKIMRTSSTRRVKTNINYITPQEKEQYHNMVMQLKPTTFELINEPGKTDLGLIAEDVYDVCHIAALEEERAIYDITEEEAKELDRDREIIGIEKTGEIENYKDRAILAMLIADNQYKDSQIEALKEQVANLSELVNSLIEKQDSNSSLWK